MKRLSLLLVGLLIGIGIVSIATPTYAATSKDAVCAGIGLTDVDGDGTCDGAQGASSVDSIIKTVVDVLTFIVGVAAVIMIILSGFKYITSSGDSNSISSAKSTITYAIVGLIIVALAQVIVRFVLTETTPPPPAPPGTTSTTIRAE